MMLQLIDFIAPPYLCPYYILFNYDTNKQQNDGEVMKQTHPTSVEDILVPLLFY